MTAKTRKLLCLRSLTIRSMTIIMRHMWRKMLHSNVVVTRKMEGIVLFKNPGFKFKKEMCHI